MAASYVPVICKAQPRGPYLIAGWSFGGMVALEVAQRISGGDQVALLAIMDQSPEVPGPPPGFDDTALIRDVLPPEFPLSAEEMRRLGSVDDQLRYLVDTGRQNGLLPPGFGVDETRRILKMLKIQIDAGTIYRARPYPDRITLLRAEDQEEGLRDSPTLGWAEYAHGGIDIHPVPGTHQTMMSEPHVAVLAARLTECLNRARAGAKRGLT